MPDQDPAPPGKTILVLGYGNVGRMDDGLGPRLAERLEAMDLPGVTVDADYQLTVEDAEAASRHAVVVFADASPEGPAPYYFHRAVRGDNIAFSTHSVNTGAVLHLAETCFAATPTAYILGIRGYDLDTFEEALTERAEANLEQALAFLVERIRLGDFEQHVTGEGEAAPPEDTSART